MEYFANKVCREDERPVSGVQLYVSMVRLPLHLSLTCTDESIQKFQLAEGPDTELIPPPTFSHTTIPHTYKYYCSEASIFWC